MATITESGLFPPIIDSYLPGFNLVDIYQNDLTINFNISEFNDPTNIDKVHVSIIRQSNYQHIFNNTLYPLGIYVVDDYHAPIGTTDTNITIPFEILNLQQINYNEYYKVQIRFDNTATHDVEYPSNPTGKALSNYLNSEQNLKCFSEWSTVCLIKFIAPSSIEVYGNNEVEFNPSGNNTITSSMLQLIGNFIKNDIDITDFDEYNNLKNGKLDSSYLTSYSIQIEKDNEILFQSGELETDKNNPNSINYIVPFYFESTMGTGDTPYTLKINYTTSDLYEPPQPISYTLNVNYSKSAWNTQGNPVTEAIAVDSVIGKVAIVVESLNSGQDIPLNSKVIIRRSSEENNDFTIWDTIYTKTITTSTKIVAFNDFTIESGVVYKYEINYVSNTTPAVTYSIVEGPILSVFDHAFLTGEGTQLCVKFNPNISGFKHNVSDNITTTIGGQFPYISRNGSMHYRSFSLSGTIAYEMDAEHQFSSRTSIYGDWINVYGSYFVNHYYNQRNDRITQRKFRELVETYLYDDIPKLFRSTPEGNILVRITDVNLTPNNQLGRMIYDFSCTATEIGDCTIDNYKLYQIQDFGDE